MDARSLLRAKKAEARVEHQYASYTAAGILRCSICAIPVKQWDAHLLTKQHRTSVAREKAIQAKATARRPAEESMQVGGKRARLDDDQDEDDGDTGEAGTSALPAGFFSNGNRPTDLNEDEGDEDAEEENQPGPSTAPPPPPAKTGDAQLDDFFASLADDTPDKVTGPAPVVSRRAVPSNRNTEILAVASYESGPIRNIVDPQKKDDEEEREPEPEETEQERRARVAREEREEIMGRLEEEERAQEDADSRVTILKQRMESMRKRRETATKTKQKVEPNNTAVQ